MARVLRWAASHTAGAIAVSEAVGRDARAMTAGLPVEVIANAIDVNAFCPGPSRGHRLDELVGLPAAGPDTVRIGLVATYARWKGQDVFLEAAARVIRDHSRTPARFYLIG